MPKCSPLAELTNTPRINQDQWTKSGYAGVLTSIKCIRTFQQKGQKWLSQEEKQKRRRRKGTEKEAEGKWDATQQVGKGTEGNKKGSKTAWKVNYAGKQATTQNRLKAAKGKQLVLLYLSPRKVELQKMLLMKYTQNDVVHVLACIVMILAQIGSGWNVAVEGGSTKSVWMKMTLLNLTAVLQSCVLFVRYHITISYFYLFSQCS